MKTTMKFNRKRLREILEKYDGNLRMFETLRSNSYEQVLAAQSLDDLELFYSKIFAPGVSLSDTAKTCPPWPDGTPHAGKPPKHSVVEQIYNRFTTERGLEKLAVESEMMAAFRRAVKALPDGEQLKLLDQCLTSMGQEVVAGKLRGLPISQQLQPVDRLLARQKLSQREGDLEVKKIRVKLEERKVKVLEKKYDAEEKSRTPAGPVTKEAWEQMERDLKLL
jgi:hypothetical protein